MLAGESIITELDEQIVYDQLDLDESAVWSLLLASGYLTIKKYWTEERGFGGWRQLYELRLTNLEVRIMFAGMVKGWFAAGIKTIEEKRYEEELLAAGIADFGNHRNNKEKRC